MDGISKLFERKKPFEMVKEWMDIADQLKNPNSALYANLITEEYEEFKEAFQNKDEVEQLDAVCDLIWVAAGYAHTKGWDLTSAFAEVGRSNYSKFPTKKDPDTGKVLKSKNFSKPDLKKFITD
jgi:hypothetical protein